MEKKETKLPALAKRMVFTILIIALLCTLGSVIYYRSLACLPFVFGVLLGSVASIVKVFLLERTVNKVLAMEGKHAGSYAGIQYLIRLLLSGVVLFLGAVVPRISLWGVVAGILAFQLAVYNLQFSAKR